MTKQRQPLSTKKPPVPSDDHQLIKNWMEDNMMPKMQPLVKRIDDMIHEQIPNLQYAIKWGSLFYGTAEKGWLIEVAAYAVSINLVFLSGADFDPQPPLGNDDRSRYIKLKTESDIDQPAIRQLIEQAHLHDGWQ